MYVNKKSKRTPVFVSNKHIKMQVVSQERFRSAKFRQTMFFKLNDLENLINDQRGLLI